MNAENGQPEERSPSPRPVTPPPPVRNRKRRAASISATGGRTPTKCSSRPRTPVPEFVAFFPDKQQQKQGEEEGECSVIQLDDDSDAGDVGKCKGNDGKKPPSSNTSTAAVGGNGAGAGSDTLPTKITWEDVELIELVNSSEEDGGGREEGAPSPVAIFLQSRRASMETGERRSIRNGQSSEATMRKKAANDAGDLPACGGVTMPSFEAIPPRNASLAQSQMPSQSAATASKCCSSAAGNPESSTTTGAGLEPVADASFSIFLPKQTNADDDAMAERRLSLDVVDQQLAFLDFHRNCNGTMSNGNGTTNNGGITTTSSPSAPLGGSHQKSRPSQQNAALPPPGVDGKLNDGRVNSSNGISVPSVAAGTCRQSRPVNARVLFSTRPEKRALNDAVGTASNCPNSSTLKPTPPPASSSTSKLPPPPAPSPTSKPTTPPASSTSKPTPPPASPSSTSKPTRDHALNDLKEKLAACIPSRPEKGASSDAVGAASKPPPSSQFQPTSTSKLTLLPTTNSPNPLFRTGREPQSSSSSFLPPSSNSTSTLQRQPSCGVQNKVSNPSNVQNTMTASSAASFTGPQNGGKKEERNVIIDSDSSDEDENDHRGNVDGLEEEEMGNVVVENGDNQHAAGAMDWSSVHSTISLDSSIVVMEKPQIVRMPSASSSNNKCSSSSSSSTQNGPKKPLCEIITKTVEIAAPMPINMPTMRRTPFRPKPRSAIADADQDENIDQIVEQLTQSILAKTRAQTMPNEMHERSPMPTLEKQPSNSQAAANNYDPNGSPTKTAANQLVNGPGKHVQIALKIGQHMNTTPAASKGANNEEDSHYQIAMEEIWKVNQLIIQRTKANVVEMNMQKIRKAAGEITTSTISSGQSAFSTLDRRSSTTSEDGQWHDLMKEKIKAELKEEMNEALKEKIAEMKEEMHKTLEEKKAEFKDELKEALKTALKDGLKILLSKKKQQNLLPTIVPSTSLKKQQIPAHLQQSTSRGGVQENSKRNFAPANSTMPSSAKKQQIPAHLQQSTSRGDVQENSDQSIPLSTGNNVAFCYWKDRKGNKDDEDVQFLDFVDKQKWAPGIGQLKKEPGADPQEPIEIETIEEEDEDGGGEVEEGREGAKTPHDREQAQQGREFGAENEYGNWDGAGGGDGRGYRPRTPTMLLRERKRVLDYSYADPTKNKRMAAGQKD